MRNLFSYAVLILMISFAFPAKTIVLEGNSNCALGDFIIKEASNPIMLNGLKLDTYTISYENSTKTVTVAVSKEKDCCKYFVFTDELSVQYNCYEDYFGVCINDKKCKDQGLETDTDMLDLTAYHYQKVITKNKEVKNLKGCLGLIAVYYPKLMKDYEKVFACK